MATVTKRGKGYKITVSAGYDIHGKQVRQYMTWKPEPEWSEKKIQSELARAVIRFEDSVNSGIMGGHVKLSIFLDQYFKENTHLKERTRASYESYRPRIEKAMGHLYLDKIGPKQIKAFLLNLAEPGINEKTGGGLSHKSIKNYLGFLSSLFAYAMSLDMIESNPCRNIKAPGEKGERTEGYSLEEAQALIDSLEDAPKKYKAYIILAVFCGYRRGELGGLEWSDIDFANETISIRRASLYTKAKGVYTDTPKTAAGERVQKQQPIVFEALRAWRAEQAEYRLSIGDQWHDTDRVFTGDNGEAMHPNVSYNWLKRHCEKHGLRFLGIHALRHLNASLRISAGADIRTVAAAMGHSQASTTLNIYAYEFAKAQAESSEAIADLLSNKRQTNAKTLTQDK